MTVDHSARAAPRRRSPVAVLALLTGAYAAVAATTKPNTAPAVVAVAIPAAVATAWTFRQPSEPVEMTAGLRRATFAWTAVTLAGLLWEAGAYLGEHTVGQYQFPTLSVLAEPALEDPVARFAAWTVWLLAGWRLVRR
ncbi:MAG TPA: hypothetical protein VHI11_13050 [Jiangellaceae bacterium]|nr:hypothetical protein [Jiangellaceae bacterium]